MTTGTLIPITVTVDGGDEDSPVRLDALHDPADHWNGFVVPYLTREAVEALFTDAQESGLEILFGFNEDGTLIMTDYPGTEDESVTEIPVTDGRYRMDIGWTFMPAED